MISGSPTSGDAGPGRASLPVRFRTMLLAGALAAISIGLPWSGAGVVLGAGAVGPPSAGTTHAVRVIAPAAAALLWWAVRRGSTRGALGALLLAAAALPIGLTAGLTAGRIVYLVALAVAAVAIWRPAAGTPTAGQADPR